MKLKQRILLLLTATLLFGALSGCSSTKTENGVTFEKKGKFGL